MDEYKTILETTNIAVMVLEENATISMVNPQFERLTGYRKAEVEGKRRWTEFFVEDDFKKIRQYCRQRAADPDRGPGNCETEFIAKDGVKRNILLTVATVPGTRKSVASFLDITSWKLNEERLTFMAMRDPLTGLPNRVMFADRLAVTLAHAKRKQTSFAVLLLDLDNFKEINDNYGHKWGDELLRVVARRFGSILRESDTVARMSGDEFLFLFPEIAEPLNTEVIAGKILELLRKPYSIRQRRLHITGSIGISIYPDDGRDTDTLMKNADIAMYRAKQEGRDNYQRYKLSMSPQPPSLKVVLLEHDSDFAARVQKIFAEMKRPQFELEPVTGFDMGLERLENGDVDVILVDLSLPEIANPDTLSKIAERAPEVPVIALVMRDQADLAIKAARGVAQDYLIKEELSDALLVRSIQYAVERHGSQRKLRQETTLKLQSSETWLHAILEDMKGGLVLLDEQGIVLFVNPAAEIMLAQRADELMGRPFRHPVEAGQTNEFEIIRDNGDRSTLQMRVVQTKWDNRTLYIAYLHDITERNQVERQLIRTSGRTRSVPDDIIQTLALTISGRDLYAPNHPRRVTMLACAIAREIGLSDQQIAGLRLAATLHDIGKAYVPAEILGKPAQLSDVQSGLIRTHPRVGCELLRPVKSPWPLAEIVHQHHERLDGSGYPQGLSGESIILEARILAVADVVEAMTSHRSHRPPHDLEDALAEVANNRGNLYDPDAVDACIRLFNEKGFRFEHNDATGVDHKPQDGGDGITPKHEQSLSRLLKPHG